MFIRIFKEGQYTIEEISRDLPKFNKSERDRYQVFIELFDEFFKRYQNYLKKSQVYIDFFALNLFYVHKDIHIRNKHR